MASIYCRSASNIWLSRVVVAWPSALPPARWLAVLAGLLFVIILLKIGEDANYEFIYFQF